MPRLPLLALPFLLAGCQNSGPISSSGSGHQHPPTEGEASSSTHFGEEIPDPYRWLEDQDSPRTATWVKEQNAYTQRLLGQLPGRDSLRAELTRLFQQPSRQVPWAPKQQVGTQAEIEAGSCVFYQWRHDGKKNHGVLFRSKTPGGDGEVILNPNSLSEDGTVAVSGTSLSPDGRYLAWASSASGSDWRTWRVRDLKSMQDLADTIPWSKFSNATWLPDSSGFLYARYPKPEAGETFEAANERMQLCLHKLGSDPADDPVVFEQPGESRRFFDPEFSDDGMFLLIRIFVGTEDKARVSLFHKGAGPAGYNMDDPLVFAAEPEAEWDYLGSAGPEVWWMTSKGAPRRRVVKVDLRKPSEEPVEVVPQDSTTLQTALICGGKLVLRYMRDAAHELRVCDLDGKNNKLIPLPFFGQVSALSGSKKQATLFFSAQALDRPSQHFALDMASLELRELPGEDPGFDPRDYVVERGATQSKDGTRVPFFLFYKKGLALNGQNPTYLYGYGGFNISNLPRYQPQNIAWVNRGGIYAHAILRGGGEFGEAWHEAGMLDKKQNVFDDCIAVAEYLCRNDYTSPEHLAVGGRSNGGLLAAACLVQRPDLFGAAVPEVGVLDMLRYHKFTIGAAWIPEYGDPEDETMFKVLRAYSPLHNIDAETVYPPTLVMTGDHDDRVLPGHSYKFAATLQQAQNGTAPILIRIDTKAGHGAGKPLSMRVEEAVDRWAFLFWALR